MRGVEKCAIQQRLPAGQSHHPFASPSMSGVETSLHGFSCHSPVEFCGQDPCVPICSQASAHLCEVPVLIPRQHTTGAPAQRVIDHSDEAIFEDHCDPMALPICDPGSPHPYKGGSCRTLADITNFDRAGQLLLNDSVAGSERTATKAAVSPSDCFASGTHKSTLQNTSCEQRSPPGPWQHGTPALGEPSLLCQDWHVGFRRPTPLGPSLPPDVQSHDAIGDSPTAGTEASKAGPYHIHATDPASFPINLGQPACEICIPDQPLARDQYYHRMQAIRVAAPYTPPSHPARTGFSRPLELAGHAPEVDVNIVHPDPIHCVPFTSFDERNGPRVLAGGEDWGVQQFASFAITTAGLPGQPLARPLGYEVVSYPSPQIALTQDRGRDHRRAVVIDFRSHGGDILVVDVPPGRTLFQVFESVRDFPALEPLANSIRGHSVLCFVNGLAHDATRPLPSLADVVQFLDTPRSGPPIFHGQRPATYLPPPQVTQNQRPFPEVQGVDCANLASVEHAPLLLRPRVPGDGRPPTPPIPAPVDEDRTDDSAAMHSACQEDAAASSSASPFVTQQAPEPLSEQGEPRLPLASTRSSRWDSSSRWNRGRPSSQLSSPPPLLPLSASELLECCDFTVFDVHHHARTLAAPVTFYHTAVGKIGFQPYTRNPSAARLSSAAKTNTRAGQTAACLMGCRPPAFTHLASCTS